MPNIQHLLDFRVTAAMRAAFPDAPPAPAIVQSSQDPRFGDYQANGAMALAKLLKMKPRDVAAAVVARMEVSDLAEKVEIAGPGFINIRLRSDWVAAEIGLVNKVDAESQEDRLGVPRAEKPETVVVDYSAPNLAKEMHVGHLRSTIIGDALARMLKFAGHDVKLQNHVGDWGTQFGMLVAYLRESDKYSDGEPARMEFTLGHIEDVYRLAKKLFDENPQFANCAREYVVTLQAGWAVPGLPPGEMQRRYEVHRAWENSKGYTLQHCKYVYERLGVLLKDEDVRGESAYNDDLPHVVVDLKMKGLLKESEGAQCVFIPGFVAKDGSPLPLIVQKSDEGYLYATTDLAAIRYRAGELHADRVLYVVDARQAQHFQMVFACARLAGFAPESVALEHIAFGTMMGADGKPFKTRDGGTVKLMDLLDEAVTRARQLLDAKSPELDANERENIARIVGIGAVKYADLSQNRTSDYVFSWEKMLSLDGNTAPYMQYAYARIRSIFRKGGHEAEQHRADAAPIPPGSPQELALAKMILRFAEVLGRALEDYRPNVLAAYLYDLAGAFTAFYDACPVLQSEEPLRSCRLKLCDLAARVIERGLGLLGIETIERM
jgi:arginyl-tRNA synthetase